MANSTKKIEIKIDGIDKGLLSIGKLSDALSKARLTGKEVKISNVVEGTTLKDLQDALKQLYKMQQAVDINSEEFLILGQAIKDVQNELKDLKTIGLEEIDLVNPKSIGELKAAKKALEELIEEAELGTQEFKDLEKQLGAINSKLKDLEKNVEGIDVEKKIQALTKVGTALTAGLTAAPALVSAYAAKGEEAQRVAEKIQAAQLAISTAQAVSEGLLQAKILARVAAQKLGVSLSAKEIALKTKDFFASMNLAKAQQALIKGFGLIKSAGKGLLTGIGLGAIVGLIADVVDKMGGLSKIFDAISAVVSGLVAGIKAFFRTIVNGVNVAITSFKIIGNEIAGLFDFSKSAKEGREKTRKALKAELDKDLKAFKDGESAAAAAKKEYDKQRELQAIRDAKIQAEINKAQREARVAALEEEANDIRKTFPDLVKILDEKTKLQKANLDEFIALSEREKKARGKLNKEDEIALIQAYGERAALIAKYENDLRQMKIDELNRNADITQAGLETELKLIEDQLEKVNELNTASVDERIALQEKLFKKREELLNIEYYKQQQIGVDAAKNYADYTNKIKQLEADKNKAIDKERTDAYNKETELLLRGFDQRKTILEAEQAERQDIADRQLETAAKVMADSTNLLSVEKAYTQLLTANGQKYTEQANAIAERYELEKASLVTEQTRLKTLIDSGKATQEQVQRYKEILETGLPTLEIKLRADVAKNRAEAEKAAKESGIAYLAALTKFFDGPVTETLKKQVQNIFKLDPETAAFVVEQASKLYENLKQLGMDVTTLIVDFNKTAIEAQLKEIELANQAVDQAIENANARLDEARANIDKFKQELVDAESSQRDKIIQLIEREREAERKAAEDKAAAEREKIKLEKQKQALEEKRQAQEKVGQQITAVTTAIEKTATAVALALGIAQQAKLIFPANVIAIASTVTAVLTALASIGSATTKFAAGGLIDGKPHSAGGVRGTGRFNNVEVEGGEMVVNKAATSRNYSALKKINSFGKSTTFDVVPRKMASGGLLATNPPVTADAGGGGLDLSPIVSKLDEVNANLQNQKAPVLAIRQLQTESEKLVDIQQQVSY